MFMHDLSCCQGMINDEITRLNCDVTTTMNLVVVSSRILHVLLIREQALSIRQTIYNMLKHDYEQHCYFTNPVLSC